MKSSLDPPTEHKRQDSFASDPKPDERSPYDLFQATFTFFGSTAGLTAVIKYMPKSLEFRTIVVWALLCSFCSGGIWSGLVGMAAWLKRRQFGKPGEGVGRWMFRINERLSLAGGINQEPEYSFDSFLFACILFGPLTSAAYLIQRKAGTLPHASAFLAFLLGAILGSLWFYATKTRQRVLKRGMPYKPREIRLVWTWSAKLAIPSLVLYEFAALLSDGVHSISLQRLLTRALVITVLPLVITLFVLVVPGDDQREGIRGVIAGGFLVLVFLTSLLLMEPADLKSWLDEITGVFSVLS